MLVPPGRGEGETDSHPGAVTASDTGAVTASNTGVVTASGADRSADVPDGHLWLLEDVAGAPLRFSVAESGLITFGTADRRFDEVPLSFGSAARHVREAIDLGALRAAAEDPSSVTFFGVATRLESVDYYWDRLPPFLGTDVWSGDRGAYLPPDAVERAFDRLGLTPTNAFEKEVPARHFSLSAFTVPDSNWYDGPAAGVLFRNKTGDRALLPNPDIADRRPEPLDESPADVTDRVLTDECIDRAANAVAPDDHPAKNPAGTGQAAGVEATFERALEDVVRREYARLYRDGDLVVDSGAFRSAAVARVQRYLYGDG